MDFIKTYQGFCWWSFWAGGRNFGPLKIVFSVDVYTPIRSWNHSPVLVLIFYFYFFFSLAVWWIWWRQVVTVYATCCPCSIRPDSRRFSRRPAKWSSLTSKKKKKKKWGGEAKGNRFTRLLLYIYIFLHIIKIIKIIIWT